MKRILFTSLLTVFSSLSAEATAQISQLQCPHQVEIKIKCLSEEEKDFQLIEHLGQYSYPEVNFNPNVSRMICTYRAINWFSLYKIPGKTKRVAQLGDMVEVVQAIQAKGFNTGYFSNLTSPYSMLTFKQQNQKLSLDQLFLFSGIESTYENQNFNVAALNFNKVSTVVVNDKYLKTRNNAADAFFTGSKCLVSIK